MCSTSDFAPARCRRDRPIFIAACVLIAGAAALVTLPTRASAEPARSRASDQARQLLVSLTRQVDRAWTAARRGRPIARKASRRLAKTTRRFTAALAAGDVQAAKACAKGARSAREAARAAGKRRQMTHALKAARKRLRACTIASKPTQAPQPPPPPALGIAGRVAGSGGQPLGNLPIRLVVTTSPWGEYWGHTDFNTITKPDGTFAIDADPDALGALHFRAEAIFPWRGATWTRDLTPVDDHTPEQLAFRADLVTTTDAFGRQWGAGPDVVMYDTPGCMESQDNPDYPESDPSTNGVIVSFAPNGPMVDGSQASAFTVNIDDKIELCADGARVEVPAGSWTVSAVTDTGRPLVIQIGGSEGYFGSVSLFTGSQPDSSPRRNLEIAFAG